ncbi:MAG: chemotaxis protein CheB [Pyrinomonadaceae bacterium]|nr:chemotaxis protein CheB [Sphingobacteriaceae bacterium]
MFSRLPDHNNAAFIIIQHLHRNFRSLTDELLTPFTKMPVQRAVEGMLIRPNCVYVLPENKMMTVKVGCLIVTDRPPEQIINRAVDIFFESLSVDMQARAIGVVLTGEGTDGTAGSYLIYKNGGIVMVQTPSTAEFKGMPQSLVSHYHPNFNMPIEGLVDTLIKLTSLEKQPD